TINARNSVYANSITSSDIECGSSLMLLGNYGCYVGGFCSLEDDLIAKDIGNETGVVTEVEIHGTPKLEREKAMCENLLETYAEKREAIHNLALERAKSVMGNKKELKIIARLLFLEHRLDKEIVRLTPRVAELTAEISDSPPGKITVTGCMHQNVTLTLNGTSKRSTKERTAFTAYKYRDLIRYRSLETPTDDGNEP
ncbi:MAG: FapA family protein, partial [Oscillospiraceae bacterium]